MIVGCECVCGRGLSPYSLFPPTWFSDVFSSLYFHGRGFPHMSVISGCLFMIKSQKIKVLLDGASECVDLAY